MSKILKNIYIDNKKYDIPDISGDVLTKDNTTSFVPTGDYNPATKKYVDDSVSTISAYKYKGSVASYSALPSSGNAEGDVWNVTDTGMNYAWTGSTWDALGATVDMSNYIAKNNTTAFTPTGDYNPATKKYVDDSVVEYNAGEGISIGNVSMNARRGPSPYGFHVPAITEWRGLKTIMDGLSLTTGNGWRVNLHMPFTGDRSNQNASIDSQGSIGSYWSSSPESALSTGAGYMYLNSLNVIVSNLYRANGYSVRCFKDSYVTPDSTWTVVQGTLGSAGIFWNKSEGLISITDGSTGYTMMDKNLGATTVYNDGDTLSEANCGKYYQWGNNYGFQRTGSITTSSTQVDASAYGPGNYYSSDTFIVGNDDWSSVRNSDLWGDTTGTYTLENAITNIGVTSINGKTGNITIVTSEIVYVTQTEYDALPSTKLTDGKHYFIYE